ncbi:MAG: ATP-binding protein, partial [Planctomycetia bacterium]|nr:ATP-binding protein [Planctomycetia bacterium]
ADIAQLATYRINHKTWEMSGNKLLPEFWPIKDGKAVEAHDWVYPDDVQLCEENYAAVIEDRLPQTAFVYRVVRDDGMHYYRIYVHKMPEYPDEITGLIHDITPFIEAQKQKETVLNMWRSIVDSVPAIFYTKDAENDFRYLQCNRHVTDVFGVTPEEVIGHTDSELFPRASDAKQVRENDVQVVTLGKPQKCLELLQDPSGTVRRFESTKIPIRDNEGRSVVIGMALEVTELQELSEIRKIISSAFELLFVTEDQAGGIQAVLKSVCEFIGFSRAYVSCINEEANTVSLYTTYVPEGEKLMFDNYVFMIDEARQATWFSCLMDAKRGDTFDCDFSKPEDREQAAIHTPGILSKVEEFRVTGVHVNYISVGDKPWGSVGFVTERGPAKRLSGNELRMLEMIAHIIELSIFRKQMIEKLEVALKDAKAADKAKSFFLASMSHEIRTPLNAVIGFADILRDAHLDPLMQQEYLSNISMAGSSLLQLVNDILDLSKLEAGQVEFVTEKTNMNDYMRRISGLFSLSADQKNLRLVFETDEMPELYVDQQRLRQILFNLIGNAIKFTHVGGIKVTTKFHLTGQNEGTLSIAVADTGIGVAKDDQDRLFQPFVQLTRMRGTNSVNNGTGLGLPIVKKMITQLGGTITLESEQGKGSTFFLTFPEVEITKDDVPKAAKEEFVSTGTATNKQYHVLLVDDVPLNLKVLGSMLKRLHVTYKTAASGKEALEILKQEAFDIVLTDLVMPEMNGSELAKVIRFMPEYASIRVAAVTGERDKAVCDRELFDQIIEKPISMDELYEYIFGTGR